MSYPYPQDRARNKRTKGEEPYEDAREDFGENEAKLERTAPLPDNRARQRSREEQEQDAEKRFEQIGADGIAHHGDVEGNRS